MRFFYDRMVCSRRGKRKIKFTGGKTYGSKKEEKNDWGLILALILICSSMTTQAATKTISKKLIQGHENESKKSEVEYV